MARMHTRKKGKSSSKHPVRKFPPSWIQLSQEEIERTILKLRDEGLSPSRIGIVLRDRYGIPSIKLSVNKKITRILDENDFGLSIPEDLSSLLRKAVRLHKHLEKNRKDIHNRRNLQRIESKIRRLAKYYRRTGKLPEDWEYSPEKAEILLSR